MKTIIITIGPRLLNTNFLNSINADRSLLRINGAHGLIGDIENQIDFIRKVAPDFKILIDLPGNKVRTSNKFASIKLEHGKDIRLKPSDINFPEFHSFVNEGDSILASDSTIKFVVKKIVEDEIILTSFSEGELLQNKGLHLKGIYKDLPFLFEKDLQLINIVNSMQIDFVGLSFVRSLKDIVEAKALINKSSEIIAKVETESAIRNLNEILNSVNYILIDRGDLSADVGITKVPIYQKHIIEKALFFNKKVFLATQFLKNMETKPIPTIAEVIDLYNTLKTGIFGIQLSEETAIGQYPLECISIIDSMLQEIKSESSN